LTDEELKIMRDRYGDSFEKAEKQAKEKARQEQKNKPLDCYHDLKERYGDDVYAMIVKKVRDEEVENAKTANCWDDVIDDYKKKEKEKHRKRWKLD
jgi:hypothetical protein